MTVYFVMNHMNVNNSKLYIMGEYADDAMERDFNEYIDTRYPSFPEEEDCYPPPEELDDDDDEELKAQDYEIKTEFFWK